MNEEIGGGTGNSASATRRARKVESADEEIREAGESRERWLVSYADFITLMFAVFVLLYSVSMQSAAARAKTYQSITKAVGARAENPEAEPLPALAEVKSRIESKLSRLTNTGITLKMDARGLVISLSAYRFFASGEASLNPDRLPALDLVIQSLQQLPNEMQIEGFTDSIPIRNERFADNWDLSAARAGNVLRYLIEHSTIAPERLSLAGYGPYRPVASNDAEEGRSLNRRVDIVIPHLPANNPAEPTVRLPHAPGQG